MMLKIIEKKELRLALLFSLSISLVGLPAVAQDSFVSQNPEDVSNSVTPEEPTNPGCVDGCSTTIPECPAEGVGNVEWKGGSAWLWSTYWPAGMWPTNNYSVRSLFLHGEAGWYNIYRIADSIFADSKDHQRNESAFISVPNGYNPGGKPNSATLSDQNRCYGFAIMRDSDNDGTDATDTGSDTDLHFGGTFYLTPGHNWAMVSEFCKLKNLNIGEPGCEGIEDTGINNDPDHEDFGETTRCFEPAPSFGGWGGHWGTLNSLGFSMSPDSICAVPEGGLETPTEEPVPEPRMFDDFTGCAVQDHWVATYQSYNELNSIKYHDQAGFEWISGEVIPNVDFETPGGYQPGAWSNDDAHTLYTGDADGNERHTMVTWWNEGPSFIHYLPDEFEKNYVDLAWKNYVYTGAFRLRNGTSPMPDSFGPTIYSEFPYMPRAYSLRSVNGGSFVLDDINIVDGRTIGFKPGSSGSNDSFKDTNVTPQKGSWYAFKIDARTTFGGVYIRAKIWPSDVLNTLQPQSGDADNPTWADIEADEPPNYQAHIRNFYSDRLGAGTVGMEYTGGSGGMHVDYLRVVPTTDLYPVIPNPYDWDLQGW